MDCILIKVIGTRDVFVGNSGEKKQKWEKWEKK